MAVNTYVTSLNGMTNSLPYALNGDKIVDAGDIHLSGSSGDTVAKKINNLAANVRPLYTELIEDEDYRIALPDGISV